MKQPVYAIKIGYNDIETSSMASDNLWYQFIVHKSFSSVIKLLVYNDTNNSALFITL
jgi:hypothetical protein